MTSSKAGPIPRAVLLVAAVLVSACITDDYRTSVIVEEAGIFRAHKPFRHDEDPPGRMVARIGDWELIKRTAEIPAVPGTLFGIQFRMRTDPPIGATQIRIVWEAPSPIGAKAFNWRVQTVRTYWIGQTIDEDWGERANGVWRVYILHEGQVLYTQSFRVVASSEA